MNALRAECPLPSSECLVGQSVATLLTRLKNDIDIGPHADVEGSGSLVVLLNKRDRIHGEQPVVGVFGTIGRKVRLGVSVGWIA